MTILTPTPVTINIEDAFLITNNADPANCPIEWEDSEGNWRKWDGILDLVWVRRHYIIPPGAQRQVPFDVVRLYFGDPRSVVGEPGKFEDFDGKRGDIAPREKEVQRVAGLWGLYDQNIHMMQEYPVFAHTLITTIGTPDSPLTEIFTPAVDPAGNMIYGHQRVNETSYDLATLLSESRKKQDAMQAQIDRLEAALGSGQPTDDESLPKDGPVQ